MSDPNDQIQRSLVEVQIAVAAGFAAVNARLDATKDHEPRLRTAERLLSNQLSRDDVSDMITASIDSASRPAWRDVGALVTALVAIAGLAIAVIDGGGPL